MSQPHIIYLHGFKSSSQSTKAQQLKTSVQQLGLSAQLTVPDLHHRPAQAISQIQWHTIGKRPEDITLVGSSLGGFYATVLAERMGMRAVVINPPIRPQLNLESYIGLQKNSYSDDSFEFTQPHIDELKALQVQSISKPSRYWLLCATDDEVCDYRASIHFYSQAQQTVIEGVGHELSNFADYIPRILAFAGMVNG
jgi:uncharacterized protein